MGLSDYIRFQPRIEKELRIPGPAGQVHQIATGSYGTNNSFTLDDRGVLLSSEGYQIPSFATLELRWIHREGVYEDKPGEGLKLATAPQYLHLRLQFWAGVLIKATYAYQGVQGESVTPDPKGAAILPPVVWSVLELPAYCWEYAGSGWNVV